MANDAGGGGGYDMRSIEVLEGLEPVRRRPGMYVGDTHDGSGLHHLLWERVGNVIDLHLARRAAHLRVDLGGGWVEVEDDGPGFPIGVHPRSGKSAVEVIMTTLYCGAAWDDDRTGYYSGLLGVGLAVVNALSEELEIETRREGRLYRQCYRRSLPLGPLEDAGPSARTGTRLRFRPDPTIFSRTDLDASLVRERLHELAYLNPALTVHFGGEGFRERLGLQGWIASLARARGAGREHPVVTVAGEHEDVQVEVALTWAGRGPAVVHSFVCQNRTREGAHLKGLRAGLRQGLFDPGIRPGVARELLADGLLAAIHVGLHHPRFDAPTRDRLRSPEAHRAVRILVRDRLRELRRRGSPLLEAIAACGA